ncbi:Sodium/hydrogen exchanger 7, partial [Geodia barretti]
MPTEEQHFEVENCSSNATHHGGAHSAHTSPGTVLFLFAAFAVGALVRHVLKRTPIPYTVLLMVVGLIIGALSEIEVMSFLQEYTKLASIDPHLMLFIFLPTLIFESAFVMDVHTFRKTIGQAV